MNFDSRSSFDPATLTALASSLSQLPVEEARKAKLLFIRNQIADYKMMLRSSKSALILFGVLSIIPVFLVPFGFAFFQFRAAKENGLQKIKNALDVWKEDLGPDYFQLRMELNA